ncbi:alpha/beta hydrolase family protein [Galbibacter pacificus]|uniref:Prolyl oligopeptidase family serine peptidase n=1 Tax=Galbibacter pacificus TaxID=2996052 RepID=A0ABT6FUC2_9FLAO|nr:prolyl oligopeptidase family serine peptidase [Galbibacter pacificus]MDG3583365.1 prolyl oligopeptidase family serine peptidase [Galbibacter pacificus]MDG3586846.1 prolyl oligopeptidase family serine peptidase [Galbibacter pacificus]
MITKYSKISIVAICLLALVPVPAQQRPKQTIEPEDYSSWHELGPTSIAPDGKWVSYSLLYDQRMDTLFVKHTGRDLKYVLADSQMGDFSKNSQWLSTTSKQKGVGIINLQSGATTWIENGIKSWFLDDGGFIAVMLRNEKGKSLLLKNLNGNREFKKDAIKEIEVSPDQSKIAVLLKNNTVEIIDPYEKIGSTTLVEKSMHDRGNLIWNDRGDAVTFFEKHVDKNGSDALNLIFIPDISQADKKKVLTPDKILSNGEIIKRTMYPSLYIGPKKKQVFFYTQKKESQTHKDSIVEVWNAQDPLEYEKAKNLPTSRLSLWNIQTDKVMPVADSIYTTAFLSPKRNFAIVFDKYRYQPKNGGEGKSDIWIRNLSDGSLKLVLKKYHWNRSLVGMSPDDRYISYFKDGNWWVYEVGSQRHRCLTQKLSHFTKYSSYSGKNTDSYEFVGWSSDAKYMIVHDNQGVWLLNPQSPKPIYIGLPKNEGVRLKVAKVNHNKKPLKSFDALNANMDMESGLLLEATDNKYNSGYYQWDFKKGLQELVFENAKINNLQKAARTKIYIVTSQTAEVSPQILIGSPDQKPEVLVSTNTHQKDYLWTRAELIEYKNEKGEKLKGILYYPNDYNPHKKHPMIVYLYERQSQYIHDYQKPSLYNTGGFNQINYTSDGYFVLYPDITYQIGAPGPSAVNCVEAAVKKVLDVVPVYENAIGLIGHSFGGYETTYISVKSDLFKTAVAGGAVTDFVSSSLSLETSGESRMWRYMDYQMRMGEMLYDDFNGYLENSTIRYADQIKIPLLIWTGKKDYHVGLEQSMYLHMALRNLNKENVLLRYKGEGHILLNPKAQYDATVRIKAWFDHYLRGLPMPKGISWNY